MNRLSRRARMAWLLELAVALAACSGATDPSEDPLETPPEQSSEVVLTVGSDVIVPGSVLRLSVVRVVSDSRCPVDVTCVWAGDTELEVGVALGTGPTIPGRVHLNSEAGPTSIEHGNFRVTLVDVAPEARSSVDIADRDYRFRFGVEETR